MQGVPTWHSNSHAQGRITRMGQPPPGWETLMPTRWGGQSGQVRIC